LTKLAFQYEVPTEGCPTPDLGRLLLDLHRFSALLVALDAVTATPALIVESPKYAPVQQVFFERYAFEYKELLYATVPLGVETLVERIRKDSPLNIVIAVGQGTGAFVREHFLFLRDGVFFFHETKSLKQAEAGLNDAEASKAYAEADKARQEALSQAIDNYIKAQKFADQIQDPERRERFITSVEFTIRSMASPRTI
jgi:hypothetical protein